MKTILVFLALAITFLSGCATFRGMAQDAENLMRGIKRSISD